MKFKLRYQNYTFVRWENWEEFLEKKEKINYEKIQKIALFFVTYNLSDSVKKLIETLNQDPSRKLFDIIIIDNHSEDIHKKKIVDFLKKENIKNIIYLYTRDNLWWSGGNAIGWEYILSQNYEYVIFTEDDAFPINSDLVNNMLKNKNKKTIVRTKRIDGDCPSNPFHFTLFPIKFIELLGVPNPSFFMRADDEDFYFRMEKIIDTYEYRYTYIDDAFTHPVIKKWWWKYWQVYFSLRNAFQTKMKYFASLNRKFAIRNMMLQFSILLGYMCTWFAKFFIEKKGILLKTIGRAIRDFLFNNLSYENNKAKLQYLWKMNNQSTLDISYERIDMKKIDILTKNKYLLDKVLSWTKTYHLKYSQKIRDFYKNGAILYTFNLPLYPLIFFTPQSISVEEYDQENSQVYIWVATWLATLKNIIFIMISCFLGVIIRFPLIIILLLKILLFKILRQIWKLKIW